MKKFYTKHFEIYWKGLWIRPFRLRETIKYLAPEEAQIMERQYTYFKNFYIEMCGMSSWGFEQKRTLFKKHPYILVVESLLDGHQFRITEKNFHPLKTRWVYEELHTSITQLARYAKSDDFIEYCKDRGLGVEKILEISSQTS